MKIGASRSEYLFIVRAPLKRCSERTNCEVRWSYSMKSNQIATVNVSTLGSDLDRHLISIPSQQLGTKSLKMRLEAHAFPDACISRCMRFQTHAFLDASLPSGV